MIDAMQAMLNSMEATSASQISRREDVAFMFVARSRAWSPTRSYVDLKIPWLERTKLHVSGNILDVLMTRRWSCVTSWLCYTHDISEFTVTSTIARRPCFN